MPLILSIDPGLSGALTIVQDRKMLDHQRMQKVPTGKKSMVNMIDIPALQESLEILVENHKPDYAAIEEPLYYFNKRGGMTGLANQFQTYGVCLGLLQSHNIKTHIIQPRDWKKRFGLTKDKRLSIKIASNYDEQFKMYKIKNVDICEAFLIGVYAEMMGLK